MPITHKWYWKNSDLVKDSSGNISVAIDGPKSVTFEDIQIDYLGMTTDSPSIPSYAVHIVTSTNDYSLDGEDYVKNKVVTVSEPDNNGDCWMELVGETPIAGAMWKAKKVRISIQTY